MLEYLHVKNLALIEECEVDLGPGLNIFTGETGAGKSVLLGSVGLALGGKGGRDMIRSGADEAYVELGFSLTDEVKGKLRDMDFSCESGSVFISRKITQTKDIFKINGETASAKSVKELASELIDVHGQNEHQSLLSNLRQRDMLDAYGGDKLSELLTKVEQAAKHCNESQNALKEAEALADGRERQISFLKFEIDEIRNADLIPGEDTELETRYSRMLSAEKLINLTREALSFVSSDGGEDAGELISRSIQSMRRAENLDGSLSNITGKLAEAEELVGDFSIAVSEYLDKLDFSEEDFSKTEERLNLINGLKSRFGNTIEKILKYCGDREAELEKLENLDNVLEKLKKDNEQALKDYHELAGKLSDIRKKTASEFEKNLSNELASLSFASVSFTARITTDEEVISPKGSDSVEFMISTNPGEAEKPMKNVASGGELSRIMLGIKTILAKADRIDALIFDEIDAGISGRTAWEVSKKLYKLSREHQVIAITHLAQIAAMSDIHYEIEKNVLDDRTFTRIHRLDEEGSVLELARLLGSDEAGEATLTNARELRKQAKEFKK